MVTNCLLQRIARFKKRGGFTLVELLVVIAIIAILAGVALGPITNGIKQAKHNAAMQQARSVGQVSFNFATDNTSGGNRYPSGTTAAAIVQTLVTSGYASDATIFYVSGQKGAAAATTTTIASTNVSWSFTVDTDGSTGVSSPGDSIPMVYFNASSGSAAFAFTGSSVAATVTSNSPQGTEGIAVFYKGNNAVYIKGPSTGTGVCPGVVPASNTDTTVYKVAP